METYSFAVAQATRLLERLAFQMNGAAHSPHAGAIHDLRVAMRRFSQVLSACKACFPARSVRKMRRRLKLIMTLAGEVRDTDVALQLIAAAGASSLEAKLRARRKTAAKTLVAALKHWTARKSVSKWRAALESGIPSRELRQSKAEAFAHRELPRLGARFFREGARAAAPEASAGGRPIAQKGKPRRGSFANQRPKLSPIGNCRAWARASSAKARAPPRPKPRRANATASAWPLRNFVIRWSCLPNSTRPPPPIG